MISNKNPKITQKSKVQGRMNNIMSRLTDKFLLMKNMNRDAMKEYIKMLADSDKNMLLISFVKMYQSTVENKTSEVISCRIFYKEMV